MNTAINNTVRINHNQIVFAMVGNRGVGARQAFGKVGTTFDYCDEETRTEMLPVWRARGEAEVWVNQDAAMLCNDPSYFTALQAARVGALEIVDGGRYVARDAEGNDVVWVARIMGNFSDMIHFSVAK